MRCYICDSELHEVHLDADFKTLPCASCQEVIDDTLMDFQSDETEVDIFEPVEEPLLL